MGSHHNPHSPRTLKNVTSSPFIIKSYHVFSVFLVLPVPRICHCGLYFLLLETYPILGSHLTVSLGTSPPPLSFRLLKFFASSSHVSGSLARGRGRVIKKATHEGEWWGRWRERPEKQPGKADTAWSPYVECKTFRETVVQGLEKLWLIVKSYIHAGI